MSDSNGDDLLSLAGWSAEEILQNRLVIWGASQNPPMYSMKSIAAKLEVSAAELSDLFGPKPRRSYAKLRRTIKEGTSA